MSNLRELDHHVTYVPFYMPKDLKEYSDSDEMFISKSIKCLMAINKNFEKNPRPPPSSMRQPALALCVSKQCLTKVEGSGKSSEAKKLSMESAGAPADRTTQEVIASFSHSLDFSKWLFTNSASQRALHR